MAAFSRIKARRDKKHGKEEMDRRRARRKERFNNFLEVASFIPGPVGAAAGVADDIQDTVSAAKDGSVKDKIKALAAASPEMIMEAVNSAVADENTPAITKDVGDSLQNDLLQALAEELQEKIDEWEEKNGKDIPDGLEAVMVDIAMSFADSLYDEIEEKLKDKGSDLLESALGWAKGLFN